MTTAKTTSRQQRSIHLFRERGDEIREVESGIFRVPSTIGRGFYRVDLERETCECKDHEHRRVRCLHFFAALIYAAKKRCRRASARPERRHGVQRPNQERAGGNRSGGRQGYGPRRSEEGSLRGAVPVSVAVAGLERMAD